MSKRRETAEVEPEAEPASSGIAAQPREPLTLTQIADRLSIAQQEVIDAVDRELDLSLLADGDEMVSPNEAARRVGCCRNTIIDLMNKKVIKSTRLPGTTHHKIRLSDLKRSRLLS